MFCDFPADLAFREITMRHRVDFRDLMLIFACVSKLQCSVK
jgi:hypothetical protein